MILANQNEIISSDKNLRLLEVSGYIKAGEARYIIICLPSSLIFNLTGDLIMTEKENNKVIDALAYRFMLCISRRNAINGFCSS